MSDRIQSYQAFWPFYLGEHRKPATRALHFVATNLALVCLITALATLDGRWVLGALAASYALAWISHFFIEKNRPATFKYPLWSFVSDWRMWALTWAGKLGPELARHVPAS